MQKKIVNGLSSDEVDFLQEETGDWWKEENFDKTEEGMKLALEEAAANEEQETKEYLRLKKKYEKRT